MIRLILFSILIFSCNTEPIREEIEVGKTIKIQATNFPTASNSYNFLWSVPTGPSINSFSYTIEDNRMLFTPNISGNYDITLLVESFDKTTLHEEVFIYSAFGESSIVVENTIDKDEKQNKKTEIAKQTKKQNAYTIQIASWPKMEQAIEHQTNLKNLGYDSYIEEIFVESKNQTWWRVRVGHFTDKSMAESIKIKLSESLDTELWIDFVTE